MDYKCWHIKVDKNNDKIYISTLDGSVLILNKNNLNILNIIDDFLIPVELCIDYIDNKMYVADLGYKQIKILDYNNYKNLGCIEINGNPQGIELSKDGKRLFVTDTLNNTIKVYDTKTRFLIDEIKVGKEPTTILIV